MVQLHVLEVAHLLEVVHPLDVFQVRKVALVFPPPPHPAADQSSPTSPLLCKKPLATAGPPMQHVCHIPKGGGGIFG